MNRSVVLSLLLLLSHPDSGMAEAKPAFLVQVRAVEASDVISPAEAVNGCEQSVDPALRDLREKLSRLHYKKFRLLEREEKRVVADEAQRMQLVDGHLLRFRAEESETNRVGLWLKWDDGAGDELLNTMMHLTPGESMLTGVEEEGDQGLVIAISVSPSP